MGAGGPSGDMRQRKREEKVAPWVTEKLCNEYIQNIPEFVRRNFERCRR